MKTILIINGQPNSNSYCSAFASARTEGASNVKHHVVWISHIELKFDRNPLRHIIPNWLKKVDGIGRNGL